MFSVGPSRGYVNDGLTQLELELSRVPELAIGRIMARKEIRLCKEDFLVCCSDSETVMIPLPGYDY
jgi:hypothetical protein